MRGEQGLQAVSAWGSSEGGGLACCVAADSIAGAQEGVRVVVWSLGRARAGEVLCGLGHMNILLSLIRSGSSAPSCRGSDYPQK